MIKPRQILTGLPTFKPKLKKRRCSNEQRRF